MQFDGGGRIWKDQKKKDKSNFQAKCSVIRFEYVGSFRYLPAAQLCVNRPRHRLSFCGYSAPAPATEMWLVSIQLSADWHQAAAGKVLIF